MILSEALRDVKSIYFDTSPFIYYIEEHPLYIEKMDKIIWLIKSIPIKGVCSFITLTEVLPKPIEMENQKLIQAYRQIIFKSEEFICKPVDKVIAIMAAELRAAYKIKTPDAIHLATAIRDNCDAFLTNDVRLKQVNNIRVLVLEELELDTPENGKSFTPIPPST